MTKIKTFRFMGCNNKYENEEHYKTMTTTEEIDTNINNFIKSVGGELVGITITPIDCTYHNNAGFNNIDLLYTVVYES